MELINEMYKYKELDSRNEAVIKEGIETIVTILAPFAPHIGEELWSMIGKEGSIFDISWPKYDETALVKDEVEIVVQINGKVRGKLSVAANISRDRKSTRLNSSHVSISYAVFCLKKKKT